MIYSRKLFLASLVLLAVAFFQKDRLPAPAEIRPELFRDPVQVSVDKEPLTVKKGAMTYIIRPLYTYDIYGLIASCHHSASFDDYYHKEWQDELNSKDVALLYGSNLKTGIYTKNSYKSGSWTATVQPKPGTTPHDWSVFDGACFSNNHLVALDDRVTRKMMAMGTGDQIHIKGYLVNYGTSQYPDSRHTSTVRTDRDCEVILVEEADILKSSGVFWRFLLKFSALAALVALACYVFAWYKNFCQRLEALKKRGMEMNEPSTWHRILDWTIEAVTKYSLQAFGGIFIIIAGFFVAKMAARLVEDQLKKHRIDVTVAKFIVQAVRLIVIVLAVLVALGKFGLEIAPLIAGLSVVGFATSFALQGPLSNYASGASLIFTKPFRVGDIIEVAGETGEVVDITLPRTILRTVDKTVVVIPNKHIIGEIIHNFSTDKRVDIKVGVAYKADVDRAIALMREVVLSDKRIVSAEESKIGILDFGDSSINLYARLWCRQQNYWDVLFDVNRAILEALKKNGIEIPFPQREVLIRQEKA